MRPVPMPVAMRTLMSLMIGYVLLQRALKDSAVLSQPDIDWFGGLMDIYLHGIVAHDAARPGEA
jgi:hypothetical protein